MTSGVALVTDSTSGIHGIDPGADIQVVPLSIEINGKVLREGPEFASSEFLNLMREANAPPQTHPPAVEDFETVYGPLVESGREILSLHLSGDLSRTVDHAREAASRIGSKQAIKILDTKVAGLALGIVCEEALSRRQMGQDLDAIVDALKRVIGAGTVYFSVYTLDYLYLGGRLPRIPHMGSATREDRPILKLEGGRLEFIERVVGEMTRVERMMDLVTEEFGSGVPLIAGCMHAGAKGKIAADRLQALAEEPRYSVARWFRAPLSPVLCAHTGFDVCAIGAFPTSLSVLGGG